MTSKVIKVSKEVGDQLDKFKKGTQSYNQIIESFLNYFNVTGLKPTDTNSSPLSIVKNVTERNIAILKNIETKTLDPMFLIVKQILETQKNSSLNSSLTKTSNDVNEDDVKALVLKIENYQKIITSKEAEISSLNLKLTQNKSVPASENHSEILKTIKNLLREIDNKKQVGSFKKDEVIIDKNIWRTNLDSIFNMINSVI